ncbi:hypothetical protein [Hyphomicrobium sp. 99]|uniref:hypothetical protein n=1 Tax=Hyphomicrobium sp. 99 TaxID=1163419 RepID=UPI0005F79349|nr:hypothetical protein [Hyphomicrobium sp. 99]
MFPIYELSAAPHFPEPLKASNGIARPENIVALLAQAADGDDGIEITLRNGELFIAITPG